jgi:hypothetical protein
VEPNTDVVAGGEGVKTTENKIHWPSVGCTAESAIHPKGQDRKGQDRTGQDRTGQDRTGQDRIGQDRTRQDMTGQDRTGQDRTGQDRTGQDRTGQDRTGQDRTGSVEEQQLCQESGQILRGADIFVRTGSAEGRQHCKVIVGSVHRTHSSVRNRYANSVREWFCRA